MTATTGAFSFNDTTRDFKLDGEEIDKIFRSSIKTCGIENVTLVTSTDDTTSSATTKETTVYFDDVTHDLEISKSYKNITKSKLYLKATSVGGISAYK